MPQEKSPEDLPAFLDANTLRDMSAVSKKIAMARSFVKAVSEVESGLLGEQEGTGEGFKDIAQYATIAANAARDAISTLRSIKANVEAYRGSI